ncbi:MAG: alpha/beta hydrolase-fold protein [Lachnospiraceae bacterium]|jgi:predicted alpha/beta superfamily hydrolase|nr:alpha/beta hydrolase-fold protein [Lachnospiraceae bacterium]MEE3461213.1 alpha/beta hydrolase-fold protein [Lachnospiraceae bacterium]
MEEKYFGKKRVILYPCKQPDAPLIYSNDYIEAGAEVIRMASEIGVPEFHLVTISNLSWDSDLSPWPHEPVVTKDDHFTGHAAEHMKLMENEILPWAENELAWKPGKRILAGYSMAGLFSAYAPFISDKFDGVLSVSGSVWYPGFEDYFLKTEFRKKPDAVYFSLGSKETRVSNPALQVTENVMKNLAKNCKLRGTASVYEQNPGNHFKDSELRVVKGIDWVLKELFC